MVPFRKFPSIFDESISLSVSFEEKLRINTKIVTNSYQCVCVCVYLCNYILLEEELISKVIMSKAAPRRYDGEIRSFLFRKSFFTESGSRVTGALPALILALGPET